MTSEELRQAVEQHRAWLAGTGGARADLRSANLRSADLSDADLRSADLSGADLRSADLRGADLSGANLRSADLRGADLRGAYLSDANLRSADLRGANLRGAYLSDADLSSANLRSADLSDADLRSANLRSANLRSADLRGANLRGAYLSDANLRSADLSGADLSDADLSGASLAGTCLDPARPVPALTDAELDAAGLELDGAWVLGWRTARSMYVGSTEYRPGTAHAAPWFSVDSGTPCHPGIYIASSAWLDRELGCHVARVRCRALRAELVHAGDKWRAKRLWVQCVDGTWPEVAP